VVGLQADTLALLQICGELILTGVLIWRECDHQIDSSLFWVWLAVL